MLPTIICPAEFSVLHLNPLWQADHLGKGPSRVAQWVDDLVSIH